jgi:hypothetical protein
LRDGTSRLQFMTPVLLIWGERDVYTMHAFAEASLRLCQAKKYFPAMSRGARPTRR